MNIIFLTLSNLSSIKGHGIYADLMRKFCNEGHLVHIVCPAERRMNKDTCVKEIDGVKLLKVKTLNIRKSNIVEKGLGTLLIERQFKNAIKRFWGNIQFDLILYSTPPITFTNLVENLKSQNPKAVSYLLLKDIFPQNAVDMGMFGKHSIFNWWFRRKEIALYKVSDFIGCMSPANVEFILKHNDYIDKNRVEVAPNSIELDEKTGAAEATENHSSVRDSIRLKYNLPIDKPIFIYGGNLGEPQGIDFLIQCLDANKQRKDCYFVVVGNGTKYHQIEKWYKSIGSDRNIRLMQRLPKEDYENLVKSCDVGLIFLDHRFKIPNYPSRLLPYLASKIPIIAATDINSDLGSIAEKNGYGYWCESVKVTDFTNLVDRMLVADRKAMGQSGYDFLKANYTVENTYHAIMHHFI